MPGRATRRMPQRSIIMPRKGTAMAERMPPNDSANEVAPRCQPISSLSGFKNTPKVKPSTGPLQTSRPVTAPNTTHQGFVNFRHIATRLSHHRAVAALCSPLGEPGGKHPLHRRVPQGEPRFGLAAASVDWLLIGADILRQAHLADS